MKILVLITLFFSICFSNYAQTPKHCSTQELLQRQVAKDPAIKIRAQVLEQQIKEYIQTKQNQSTERHLGIQSFNSTLIIPVVVHVVYNTPEQNISDEQVQSQIDILNADYQRLNADTALTPAPFRPIAGKLDVSFKLANIDPEGKSTNGIVRKPTSTSSFTDADDSNQSVKNPSAGGDTAWSANKYLNIWVANLAGNLLGYAQYPYTDRPTSDGVVIHYKAFGNTGTATSPYQLGRTATHEIGHWLNLYHIWGDATCGEDSVADTPVQYGDHNNECPTFPDTSQAPCRNAPNGDMFMNYMDYTDDACMNMFSHGQALRMEAVFNNYPMRSALKNSNGYTNTMPPPKPIVGKGFSIYPNPTSGKFSVYYEFKDTQNVLITVYDFFGKRLFENTYLNKQVGKEDIQIALLPAGMYFIRCETPQYHFIQKVVVERQ